MATNLVVNFLGNNKLSKTTTAVSRDLKNLGNTADKVGKTVSRALGAVGIGFGFAQLTNQLKAATKAAVEDNLSQKQLALALKNTAGATDAAIAGAETWIAKTQNATAVLDDQLRPALATAVRATGDLASGQELLNVALDVSAATGKDLNQVTKAIARAQQGQLGGLQRLIPGIKKGADVMGQLKTQFGGAAEIAANQDPFKRIQVIFNDIQETVGQKLLPYLQEFANYLASPQGQKELKKLVDGFKMIAEKAGELIKFLTKNIDLILRLAKFAIELKIAIMLNVAAMKLFTWWTNKAKGAMVSLSLSIKRTGIGLLIVGLGEVVAGFEEAKAKGQSFTDWLSTAFANQQKDNLNMMRWIFGQESIDAMQERKANAYQDRWINLGKKFGRNVTKKVGQVLEGEKSKLNAIGVQFRDAVGLAFGVSGEDEFSYFNVDRVIAKLKRMVDAAKGFKENLAKLTAMGAGADVRAELIAMGPAQGNIVAKGLLQSGKLSEYLGLRGSLYSTGVGVSSVTAGEKTYTININKANVSAADIIKEIRKFEKQTGKKYFAN